MSTPSLAAKPVETIRVRDGRPTAAVDYAAVEEPLEIRLHGTPFATIMRTPGADLELAAGFLFAERVLESPADLGVIEHCTDPSAAHAENIVNVTLVGPSADRLSTALAHRRQVVATAACGLCGRLTIDAMDVACPRLTSVRTVSGDVLAGLPDALRRAQTVFDRTGGLHAAGLFTSAGELLDVAEDVGRHNAVDKVIGRQIVRESLPLTDVVLCVSGRTAFEIVQKAWLAGIACVASVSAPTSLAIDLAERAGMTLVGFVRGGGFNIYAHAHRLDQIGSAGSLPTSPPGQEHRP